MQICCSDSSSLSTHVVHTQVCEYNSSMPKSMLHTERYDKNMLIMKILPNIHNMKMSNHMQLSRTGFFHLRPELMTQSWDPD